MSWDGEEAGRNRIDGLFSALCARQHSRSFHAASRLVFIITVLVTCQLHVPIGLNLDPRKAVPEPSTWAMMLLGFAGLGYAGYRKARQVAVAPCVTDRVAAALRSAAAEGLGR
jgi:hypothetical protein